MALRPFGILNKMATWTWAGIADKMATRFSGRKCSLAKHMAMKIDKCEPWTDHLETSSLMQVDSAIKNREFATARFLVALRQKEEAIRYCINLALSAIDFLAEGEELTFELFQCLE